ncbi:Protease HtpX [Paenibacillus polymyxa E681]|uniref:M56 family metallopeptidase n=1 Tax=Paenibacillus polymyxa TaxID=1406 RepID=UPI0001E32106|nr:M56 family metallopeptidase [Paenibacillus polymyxa]ADM72320.1 peptidase M56 [Paenibacillus polymyxa E681]QNV59345.1 Protease HtpX [Paenibacillus polymyxa E681]QNV64171.1 Protease HtpX [Paenibacillus polymyxa E681]
MWKTRSKLLFTAGALISGFALIQMGMYAGQHVFGWKLNYNVFQICRSLLQHYGIGYMVDALSGLVFVTFAIAGGEAVRQCMATRAAFRRLHQMRDLSLTEALGERYRELGTDRIWVIDYAKPAAFTMGLWKPRIVLSSALLSVLDKHEEEAVIYHEAYHMKHYDPLKTWLLQVCAKQLFYLPVLRHITHHYKTAREILADNEAIHRAGSPVGIGSALLKLLSMTPANTRLVNSAACSSFAETSINYRISRILDPQQEPVIQMPWRSIMFSSYVLVMLTLMFALALI